MQSNQTNSIYIDLRESKPLTISLSSPFIFIGTKDAKIFKLSIDSFKIIDSIETHLGSVETISSDSNRIWAGGSSGLIQEFSHAFEAGQSFQGHDSSIISVFFSQNSNKLYSTSEDCSVRQWELSGKFKVLYSHESEVLCSDFHDGGQVLASSSVEQNLIVYLINEGKSVSVHTEHKTWAVKILYKHEQLLEGNNEGDIIFRKLTDLKQLRRFSAHESRVKSIDTDKDETRIVSGSFDQQIKVWDLEGKNEKFQGCSDWVRCVKFYYERNLLLAVSDEGGLRIWQNLTEERFIYFKYIMKTLEIFLLQVRIYFAWGVLEWIKSGCWKGLSLVSWVFLATDKATGGRIGNLGCLVKGKLNSFKVWLSKKIEYGNDVKNCLIEQLKEKMDRVKGAILSIFYLWFKIAAAVFFTCLVAPLQPYFMFKKALIFVYGKILGDESTKTKVLEIKEETNEDLKKNN